MSALRSFARLASGVIALSSALLVAPSASAQPDPFDDYERFRAEAPPPSSAPSPSDASLTLRTAPWTWSMAIGSQISFARWTYQRGGGKDDGDVTTLLFRLSPSLRLVVSERFQIGVSPGFMARAGGSNAGDDTSDANMLIEVTGHYLLPLTPRTAFVPGVGVGGFFGNGKRTLDVILPGFGAVRRNTDTGTSGASVALYLGLAYQLEAHLQLRAGLAANVLFGWDSIHGSKTTLHDSATHIGLPIEISYVF